jgi:hypothetical protein
MRNLSGRISHGQVIQSEIEQLLTVNITEATLIATWRNGEVTFPTTPERLSRLLDILKFLSDWSKTFKPDTAEVEWPEASMDYLRYGQLILPSYDTGSGLLESCRLLIDWQISSGALATSLADLTTTPPSEKESVSYRSPQRPTE